MHGQITFLPLAGIAILSALRMVSRDKTLYSAFYFALTMLSTAGIFLQLRAPWLFTAQLLAVGCLLIGIIVFAIEVGKLDVAIAAEYSWRPRVVGIAATLALTLDIVLALLQRRLLPGEKITELLPRAPTTSPLSVSDLILHFDSHDLMPLALLLLMLLIATVGIIALSQRRA
jgi:NADH:ubiquinone oxidoreductase subunit 6 (subunit J)